MAFGAGCQSVEQPRQTLNVNAVTKEAHRTNSVTDAGNVGEQGGQKDKAHTVIAYYFHRTFRCPSCLAIEALSAEALESGFNKALEDGSLQWLAVNVDEPGGEKYVEDFSLQISSLVITDMQNDKRIRWKKLEKVWELKGNKDAFIKYVQGEVAAYLAGG